MNPALLTVVNASLPAKYEAATLAISECERIDECKDWADKSAALASYAKQSGDKTLENAAMRIRARAVRRCGELLKEVEAQKGGDRKSKDRERPFDRAQAAAGAGMSPRQAKDAIRVANLSGEFFESQIESEEPPTISELAEQGKKPINGIPLYEKLGMTKEQFQAGTQFIGAVSSFLDATNKYSVEDITEGTRPEERRKLRADLQKIEKFTSKLISKL